MPIRKSPREMQLSRLATITSARVGSGHQPIRYISPTNMLARAIHIETAPAISQPFLSLRIVRVSRGPRYSMLVTYYVGGVLLFMMQIYKIFSNKKNPRIIFLSRGFVLLLFLKNEWPFIWPGSGLDSGEWTPRCAGLDLVKPAHGVGFNLLLPF